MSAPTRQLSHAAAAVLRAQDELQKADDRISMALEDLNSDDLTGAQSRQIDRMFEAHADAAKALDRLHEHTQRLNDLLRG